MNPWNRNLHPFLTPEVRSAAREAAALAVRTWGRKTATHVEASRAVEAACDRLGYTSAVIFNYAMIEFESDVRVR